MGHFFSKQKSASDRSQRFSEYDGRSTYAPPPAAVYRSAHGRDDDVYGAYRGSGERSGMQRSSVTASTSAAAAPPLPPSAFFQESARQRDSVVPYGAGAGYYTDVDDTDVDAVDYYQAREKRFVARELSPTKPARGQEKIGREKPWHPKGKKAFGLYACSCGHRWSSAHSWSDTPQACKECGEDVLPYKQRPPQQRADDKKSSAPHLEALCGKCQELGRSCTLFMQHSKSTAHPNDMMIKGLPPDITETKLTQIFRPYGSILRVYLPPPNPQFSHRIAFITFQNPAAALRKFNALVDVSTEAGTSYGYGQ
ncbi:MAG: hypothetical protein A3C55_05775 [Gammaproteobacteria bacterium RIFCSPHIGHO2_02_FULL_42_13]|nr:MAG: hypothetical protein A3C55_05775 [Gammaproteobacteria bacterium RIFCSPHIGHO2_02_FULL_42_13]OGT69423.1 MAG: hypothetical protein A3H43_05415 [Gammaproteobacteria bacterium RIFCSPLOWO2_02_FULL_42_9]